MNAKKARGLTFNPLLSRTDSAPTRELGQSDEDTQTRVQAQPLTRPRVDTSTSKFTFYFTEEQLERLDRAWETMRKRTRGSRQRISKSQFVRLGLERLLDDFEREPELVINSLLVDLGN